MSAAASNGRPRLFGAGLPRGVRAAAAAALALVLAFPAAGATAAEWDRTIYVDYADGDDSADGTGPETARRTLPPPEALGPGVRVLFKGGVRYREPLRIRRGGEAGRPLVLDGNAEGEWGEGRAVLDLSKDLGPWRRVGTSGGHAVWEADLPDLRLRHGHFRIYQGEAALRIASSADLDDNAMKAQFDAYWRVPAEQVEQGLIRDPKNLSGLSDDWADVSIWVHTRTNHVRRVDVRFEPDRKALAFEGVRIPKKRAKYALLNHPDVFDAPGEYLYRREAGVIRVIPFGGADPNSSEARINAVSEGFGVHIPEASHVTVRGLRITRARHNAVKVGARGRPGVVAGIRLEDLLVDRGAGVRFRDVRDSAIERSRFYEITQTRPIFISESDRIRVAFNEVVRTPSGITGFGARQSLFLGNRVSDTIGVHGNAMTIYKGSHGSWIIGNRLNSGRAGTGLTLRNSDDLLIAFNVIHGRSFPIAQWAPAGWEKGNALEIYNNTLLGGGLRLQGGTAKKTRLINNYVSGLRMPDEKGAIETRGFNAYGKLGYGALARDEYARGEILLKEAEAFAEGAPPGTPSARGRAVLAQGYPHRLMITPESVEVDHIGALDMSGRMPDLSEVTMPPDRTSGG